MEGLIKGDVIVIPFPFSTDPGKSKRRPSLVVSVLRGGGLILCAITSQKTKSRYDISLNNNDFSNGSLKVPSFIKPHTLFSAYKTIVLKKIGNLNIDKQNIIINEIVKIIKE